MTKEYLVRVSRPRWEMCDIYVMADSPDDAIYMAIDEANRDTGLHTQNEWIAGEAENVFSPEDCEVITS